MPAHPPAAMAALDPRFLYLGFRGRLRRRHFWIAWLVLVTLNAALGFVPWPAPWIGTALSLAWVVPESALFVRRLHDIDRTGWWALLPATALVALALVLAFGTAWPPTGAPELEVLVFMALGLLLLGFSILYLVFLLIVGVSAGQPGSNRFGPDPKGG